MRLIEFSYLSNKTKVIFEHVYGFKYVHRNYGNFTDYSDLFWDNVILFYSGVGKVQIVTWRVLVQLVETVMWTEWRHCSIAWSLERCRKCTETAPIKKKSTNEYENYPQKEKLETTNEEWKQN